MPSDGVCWGYPSSKAKLHSWFVCEFYDSFGMVAGNGLFSHQKTWRTQEWHPGHVRPFHLSLVYLLCEFFFYHRRLRWLRPPRINMSDSLPTHSLVHMFFATRWGFQHLGPWSPHGISTECKFLRHQTQSFQSIAKRNSRYRNLLFVSITFGTLCQLTWATASFFFFFINTFFLELLNSFMILLGSWPSLDCKW